MAFGFVGRLFGGKDRKDEADNIFTEVEDGAGSPADGMADAPGAAVPEMEPLTLEDAHGVDSVATQSPTVTAADTEHEANAFATALAETTDAETAHYMNVFGILPGMMSIDKGAIVKSVDGDVPARKLRPGIVLATHDGDDRPARWVGKQTYRPNRLPEGVAIDMIAISKDALGDGMPSADLTVTPAQLVMVTQHENGKEHASLVAAEDLLGHPGVEVLSTQVVGVVQVMFDQHELICVNGLWMSSYMPQPQFEPALPEDQKAALRQTLDAMADDGQAHDFEPRLEVMEHAMAQAMIRHAAE